jgi:hypothetical protein
MIKEVKGSRAITATVTAMLWGRAAARCEFYGCNRPLWKSSVTQESVNVAQRAHIYAFSEGGPRGHDGVDAEAVNSIENLMLVCHECHRKIDNEPDGGRYPADLLRSWKAAHEARVEVVTGIAPSKRSHVLLYGANIGAHSSPLNMLDAAHALFPERYPAEATPIRIGMQNSSWVDRDDEYWSIEQGNLRRQFDALVKRRLASGEIEHLSVFALAPQPLLMLLGALLIDILPTEVYARRREPPTWQWSSAAHPPLDISVEPPSERGPLVALVLSISATIDHERIRRALGENVAIWTVSVATPQNDILQTREQLQEFRQRMRGLLDRIKSSHGQVQPIHVFPALPAAAAVELGRIRMPKADAPWIIYDQVNERGGFVRAVDIGSPAQDRREAEVTPC